MKFTLNNIGKIAQATIELAGLTVLGGHNDIGKSTIGKVLFAIVKTIKHSEQEFNDEKREQVREIISELSVNLRKLTGVSIPTRMLLPPEIASLQAPQIMAGLLASFEKMITDHAVEHQGRLELPRLAEVKQQFQQVAEDISRISRQEDDATTKYKRTFNRLSRSLFRGEFTNKINAKVPATIVGSEAGKERLKIVVEADNPKEFFLVTTLGMDEVTLIESPIILGLSSLLMSAPINFARNILGHYNVDLLQKIQEARLDGYEAMTAHQKPLIDQISDLIKGQVYYDKDSNDFILAQGSHLTVKSVNIAAGIKAFGILQLLLIADVIAPNTLLIIDEPEVHLHPEWQVKYAELIVRLANMGVYVLISSHSPYLLEALKFYSDQFKLGHLTHFYLGQPQPLGTVFIDVTSDLEPLYRLLALPMQRLTFER